MTSALSAIQAIAKVTTPLLEARPTSSATPAKVAENVKDTVELSDTAQQHLLASQGDTSDKSGSVKQLVRAAAAGDFGAWSLLTII